MYVQLAELCILNTEKRLLTFEHRPRVLGMRSTGTKQSSVTDPQLYLDTSSINEWIYTNLDGKVQTFIRLADIPQATFYRAWRGGPASSSLIARIHLFTNLPLAVIAHMEQRRRAS